jgi:hypothetical protein
MCIFLSLLGNGLAPRQRTGKQVPVAMNTYATIKELLDWAFSKPSVSYQRKAGDQFFLELTVMQ